MVAVLAVWLPSCATRTTPAPAAPTAAAPDCTSARTPDQQRDETTVRRIEHDWLAAERSGNTRFLECLLVPSYVNVAADGHTRTGAEIIAHAARNRGKVRDVPPIESQIVLYGDAATAYSRTRTQDAAGEWHDVRFIDSFVFVDGAWRAYTGADL